VYSFKIAPLPWRRSLPARVSLASSRHCAGRPPRAARHSSPAGASRTFVQCVRATRRRMHWCKPAFHMFLHDALFAISSRCSESRGCWQGVSKKAILPPVLRLAGASSAYSWSSARCLAALGTSPICGQAGSAGFTVSERTAISPIACIVISTDWYASSGTSSAIVDQLLSWLRAHRNCDGSGRFCQKMLAIRSYQIRNRTPLHRCDWLAPASDPRRVRPRRAPLQLKRGKPAQKRGIIPTPASKAGVAPRTTSLFDRDGAAFGCDRGSVRRLSVAFALSPPSASADVITSISRHASGLDALNSAIGPMARGNGYPRQIAAKASANRGLTQIERGPARLRSASERCDRHRCRRSRGSQQL
jgi:hypothetical protein